MKIRIIKKKNLNEEFYLYTDVDPEKISKRDRKYSPPNPLTELIVNEILAKLGVKPPEKMQRIKASGAEGIVVSLNDDKVIKIFHSLDNAAKNLPLVGKEYSGTANVSDIGTIELNTDVVYHKKGSVYNKNTYQAPTKKLWFIIMQRVTPDVHIYRYVNVAWDKINRITTANTSVLKMFYNLGIEPLKARIEKIFQEILKVAGSDLNDKLAAQISSGAISSFGDLNLRQVRQLDTAYTIYKKQQKGKFVVATDNEGARGVNLKKLLLNAMGSENDVAGADKILSAFAKYPTLERKASKKSDLKKNKSATLSQDLEEIYSLIKKIRVDQGLDWQDIHEDQFGRDADGNLVGLDLGVKDPNLNQKTANAEFSKKTYRVDIERMSGGVKASTPMAK